MNCRRVSHDWTELKEEKLPFWRRTWLRFHLAICPHCKVYVKQMNETVDALREVDEPLSEEASREIALRALRARKDERAGER